MQDDEDSNSDSNGVTPTAATPTLYDETYRGVHHTSPQIASMGNHVSLIAHLEHHSIMTDGSFGICIAGGVGNFISKSLYESIPQQHRAVLRKESINVGIMMGSNATTIGSTFVPIMLNNANDGKRFRIVVHAYVMPALAAGMFLGDPRWITLQSFGPLEFYCDFGNGKTAKLVGTTP